MNYWRTINILSIDIALGAVVGCAFFASIFGISLYPHAYLSLGLIVWIIYTVDHLLDSSRTLTEPSTERHRFHRKYARLLTIAVVAAAIIVAVQAFYVRKPLLNAGIGISILVIGYLALQASLAFLKEVAGALLYTAGIVAGPWSLLERSLTLPEAMLVALFGTTALLNLLLFSFFDRETDLQDNHSSFATTFGECATERLLMVGFATQLLASSILAAAFPEIRLAALVITTMNMMLFLTFRYRDSLAANDKYRLIGDFAFLVPVLYILYERL